MLAKRACRGHACGDTGRLRPRTRSASPSATGPTTRGNSAGSNDPSASHHAIMGADAATRPACAAAPNPRRGSCTTYAPASSATCTELSVEPLSTTIARYPSGSARKRAGSAAASLRQGKITSTTISVTVEPYWSGSVHRGVWCGAASASLLVINARWSSPYEPLRTCLPNQARSPAAVSAPDWQAQSGTAIAAVRL